MTPFAIKLMENSITDDNEKLTSQNYCCSSD